MSIPEELPPAASEWHRHIFHVPPAAEWVPEALEKLKSVPALPALRAPRREQDGGISVEENHPPGLMTLAAYLTKSAAPLWAFVSVVQQCLSGLNGLHESGLMHGALSRETLLIDRSGNVSLTNIGGGTNPEEWQTGGRGISTAGPLPQRLAARDLSDLGRVFRSVLGGDADIKMTVSRPDIAPMAAEWIDWLASPETGREPVSAAQAETVFADIRAGRAGLRPWQNKLELPPEVEFGSTKSAVAMTAEERRKLRKAAAHAHGSGVDVKNQILMALLIAALLGGGIFLTNHYFAGHSNEAASGQTETVIPGGGAGAHLQLADESGDLFAASGGDVEPLADTGETIANLMNLLGPDLKPAGAWEKALRSRKEGNPDGSPEGSPPESFLYDARIFPPLGKLTSGMEPGDYYLAWRTSGLVMTPEESMALQSALLRTARYCGVRVLAWTVLPNQAAVILRVLPRRPLPDEKLERRIAILRGEKAASAVISQLNATLKTGDAAGAEQMRRKWTASMGSASGFFSVIKTVTVVEPSALNGRPLWQEKPMHLMLLDPETPDVLQAAAIVDTAAVRGKLAGVASAWPLCGLRAALHNYGPALRAISVLMQKNPQASLPLPVKEEILKSLLDYRRYLGDLPPEPVPQPPPAGETSTPGKAPSVAPAAQTQPAKDGTAKTPAPLSANK